MAGPFRVDMFRGVPTEQIVNAIGNMYDSMHDVNKKLEKAKSSRARLARNQAHSGLSGDDADRARRLDRRIETHDLRLGSNKLSIAQMADALKKRGITHIK